MSSPAIGSSAIRLFTDLEVAAALRRVCRGLLLARCIQQSIRGLVRGWARVQSPRCTPPNRSSISDRANGANVFAVRSLAGKREAPRER